MGSPDPLKPVVLFDGVCNLCSGSVQFIIRRDPAGQFRFASLQSSYGQREINRLGIQDASLQSIVLVDRGAFFMRSNAVLEITRKLNGAWPCLYAFKIIPRFIRDAVYNWIAGNRYKFFGKKDACWIPTPELKARFID